MVIFANAVTLALSSYPENKELEYRVEFLNLIFFGFFVIELFIKITGLGLKYYFKDRYNWFDFSVVAFSTIDITLEYTVKCKPQCFS
jgi:voltage-gated sodium channel